MYFLLILLGFIALFFILWKFAPAGTLTHIKASLLVIWGAMGEIFESLSDVDWSGVVSDRQAIMIGAALGVMVILARLRGRIQNAE